MAGQASLQQLLVTNFGLSPSGYAGSRGDVGYIGSAGINGYTGSSGLGYTGSAGAGSSGPTITSITYPGDDTAADTAGGQTVTLTGTNFAAGAQVIVNGAQASVVTVVSSTTITFTAPALAAGSYIIYVVNTNGTTALLVPGIQYSGVPAWSTPSGSLGNLYEGAVFSSNLVATSDSAVTYSIASGSLPSGFALTSSGRLTGNVATLSNSSTYNFTVSAVDAQQQDTNRAFSLTLNPESITWTSPASDTTYTPDMGSAVSLTLSATSTSGNSVVFSASGLPSGLSLTGNVISGNIGSSGTATITGTIVNSSKSSTRTLTWAPVVTSIPIEHLVIGPGGDGSWGGGGAGGFVTGTVSYSVGTSRSIAFNNSIASGGGGTTFGSIFAIRGGGEGNDGGSGGGGSVNSSYGAAPKVTGPSNGLALQPTSSSGGFGHNGGTGIGNGTAGYAGGGGGGAGSAGGAASTNQGGAGGTGRQSSITGSAIWYCGGGGGGSNGATPSGGGGTAYGGGGSWTASPAYSGGPGVVILAYPSTYPSLTTSGLTFTSSTTSRTGYRVYTITGASSGSITIPAINAPSNSVAPTVNGTVGLGNTLKCSSGTWGSADFGFTFQWKRNGTAIAGATEKNYVMVADDISATITCTVTQTNISGSLSVTTSGISPPIVPTVAISYLLAAGGGGSGGTGGYGGGGGGGGLVRGEATVTANSITVTVGAGGNGGTSYNRGGNGGDSSITSSGISIDCRAVGGGGGGSNGLSGLSGGSGGGGGPTSQSGGSATQISVSGATVYGNRGGNGGGGGWHQGGGGGAGGVGDFGYFGGPAGSDPGRGTPGPGVTLDMGGGVSDTYCAGLTGNGSAGSAGAGGVVIIRYADSIPEAFDVTGSPIVVVSGGYRIYKWTSSGSITF
jgi:hypothetical protein